MFLYRSLVAGDPPNFLHSQCLQTSVDFVDFDGGEDEVNLPNDDEDTPAF